MTRFTLCLSLVLLVEVGSYASGGKPMYDLTAPKLCQDAPPITSNYTPTGTEFILDDMVIYETLDKTPRRVLIDVYDIFGFHENTKQVADILAAAGGFRIAMPDYFRGSPFNVHNFPPKDRSEIVKFIEARGQWEDSVREDTLKVIDYYKTQENITSFGIFGFCWGGKISVQAASEIDDLKVAALVHPSSVTNDEAYGVKAPMYLLPSMSEPNMIPFYEVLLEKFGQNCGHRRFDNMPHGFAGARANFSDPANVQAVNEVITIIKDFFDPRV